MVVPVHVPVVLSRYIGFVLSMKIESLPLVFLSAGLMGIFGTSVLVLGLEYGAQVRIGVAVDSIHW